jgi:hypothetical protein
VSAVAEIKLFTDLCYFIIYPVAVCVCELRINKPHGLSPRVNYTDRATAACRQSDCQLLRIECATWSA